ncbi:RnfABCDGE type electron transport complex subunit G [Clostridium frigidicarnis]|uniref:Ion-translocating oxidoreductase complex subunit G n=1 Tax=Clostridium frigidicarnis TaxID=84698 RepID=A0A1I0YI57_9CLOT|nr:RnfABCDGE type electron transport complex subunit G [Clostridium frigidicarnis]SFB13125.1 electron transport complex protein RnfG [Clostridium frigidicarnis]
MEKKESILKLGIKLLIITAVAGLILGFVFNVTKAPIADQEKSNNEAAMKELIVTADKFEKKDITLTDGVLEVNEGKKGNDVVGYTLKMSTKGYGGQIQLMVGISKEGKLAGIKILSQSETPGLGANATLPSFYEQYKEKPISKDLEVVKSGTSEDNQIQALTGATITSKAVTTGVNEAIKFYQENLEGGSK